MDNRHPAQHEQRRWPASSDATDIKRGEGAAQGLGLTRADIAEMKAAAREKELRDEREERRRLAEEAADLQRRLQKAEREKRKRQRIEPVVVVKEVVVIGDDSAEPDHWQSTNTHGTILGSTHLSRATRRATRFEV
jgi:hypothetical protein